MPALNRLLRHAHCFVMQVGGVQNPSLAYLDFGQVPSKRHSFAGCGTRALDPQRVPAVIAIKHRARIRGGRVCQSKARVDRDRVFKHTERELEVLARLTAGVTLSSQVEVVGLEIFGGLDSERFEFLGREGDAQSFGDFTRDFVLNLENVFHFAVVALGPHRKIGLRVDELSGDAEPGAGATQTAGQYVSRAQLLADLLRSYLLVAKSQNRGTRIGVEAADF